jgi:ribosome-associated protein
MTRPPLPFGIPEGELEFSFARSSGPGGQNVNKTETKATLRWAVARSSALPEAVRARFLRTFATRITSDGVLLLSSQRHRERARNIEECRAKLAEMLRAVAAPRRKRRPTRPGRGAVEARLEAKKRRGRAKRERRAPRED